MPEIGRLAGARGWVGLWAVGAAMAAAAARGEELAREDFSTAAGSSVWIGQGANAAYLDDLAGENGGRGTGTLILAGAKDEVGHAWLAVPLDPSTQRLSIEFDLFLRVSTRNVMDGFSAVLVSGGIPEAPGRAGASLGTGGLRMPYLSVAFDFRDDGGLDPESACDGDFTDRTCHLEVNRSADPAQTRSVATATELPDIEGAGAAGTPVRVRIDLNERELAVRLSTAHGEFGERDAIHVPIDPLPAGDVTFGFVACAGSADAEYAVDDLVVSAAPLDPPQVAWDAEATSGGINAGGPAFACALDGRPFDVAEDGVYGDVLRIEAGPPTRFILRAAGHVPTGWESSHAAAEPFDGLPDESLAPFFEGWVQSPRDLVVRRRVVPGRYAVWSFWAEPPGPGCAGCRRFDVEAEETPLLRWFSPAEAAAEDAGACGTLAGTAVVRRFEVDVADSTLDLRVRDLGPGSPPGDALLDGLLFDRLGDATGEAPSGFEDRRRPPAPAGSAGRELVVLDFEDPVALSEVATINRGRFFEPQVVDGRLRLADDLALLSGVSVIFDGDGRLVFDPHSTFLRIELDVFISNPDGIPPSEGLVVGIVGAAEPRAIGGPGGDLAFGGMGFPAIGVEVDLWQGGAFGDDSGYNLDGQAHVAVVGSGASMSTVDHVQDQNDLDPSLDAEVGEWIDWTSSAGVRLEILYAPEGNVTVFAEAHDGSFPRRKVLDTFVTPFECDEAVVGLFASTGARTATMEVDDLRIEASDCVDAAEEARIAGPSETTLEMPAGGTVAAEFDGTGSLSGAGEDQPLVYRWTIAGPLGGAVASSPCRAATAVSFSAPGVYELSLDVDDRRCGRSPASTARVAIVVREVTDGPSFVRGNTNGDSRMDISDAVSTLNTLFLGTGTIECLDAADANDDGRVDISDAVSTLVFLFLGGDAPSPPYPPCGEDPTEDALGCGAFPACP